MGKSERLIARYSVAPSVTPASIDAIGMQSPAKSGDELHESPAPEHAELQHTLSAQWLVWHSVSTAHVTPIARCGTHVGVPLEVSQY